MLNCDDFEITRFKLDLVQTLKTLQNGLKYIEYSFGISRDPISRPIVGDPDWEWPVRLELLHK